MATVMDNKFFLRGVSEACEGHGWPRAAETQVARIHGGIRDHDPKKIFVIMKEHR